MRHLLCLYGLPICLNLKDLKIRLLSNILKTLVSRAIRIEILVAVGVILLSSSFSALACRGGSLDFRQVVDGADTISVGVVTGLLARDIEELNISSNSQEQFKVNFPLTITYRVLITQNLLGNINQIQELKAPCNFKAGLTDFVIVVTKNENIHIRPFDEAIYQIVSQGQ